MHLWRAIGYAADRAVCDDADAGYTTLVTFAVGRTWVAGCSSGDSAALLVTGSRSVVLTENQRKNTPVGSSMAEFVAFGAELAGIWKLLAMSDGMWKYCGWDALVRACTAEQGDGLLRVLRHEAVCRFGGQLADDFSIALFEPGTDP